MIAKEGIEEKLYKCSTALFIDGVVQTVVQENHFEFAAEEILKEANNSDTGCKELLIQMLKEENEALGKATFHELHKRETHANNKYCIAIVLQLIEEKKPTLGKPQT